MNTEDPAVEMRSISKGFNGVNVLNDVAFEVRTGEVHALAGGNGAGKSTLMKILQGVYHADAGSILVAGKPVDINSIQDAKAAGIGMVFQEFSLVPSLTVAQNIFLAAEPQGRSGLIDDREAVRKAREIFADMEVDVDPRAHVSRLGTAYWQLTEIAKALAQDARVLIMDEPTASLARHETEALFDLVARLKKRGISIIYISHRMDEVYRIADRITILRDGRRLLTEPLTNVTPEQIVEGIVGKKIEGQLSYRQRDDYSATAIPVLEAKGISSGNRVRNVSFTLHAGEILGLAGLMGSGRTELARVLFGIDPLESGEIWIGGKKAAITSPRRAIEAGLALIPEDRRAQGLVLDHSVRDNLLLPLLDRIRRGPLLDTAAGKSLSSSLIKKFAVKVAHPGKPVRLLSGGNQQKVVLAKWLGTEPDVLILDEPTAGVDIGTKSEILDMIRELAKAGKAVIVISSEYPELLAVSDRVLILRDGSITGDLKRSEIADEESLQLAVQGV
ncbi:sugar ABC transporter ATP-binding protein [Pseudarthrobacter raffinosi]|uniref:sugar ABC transporter ATP-binding protein n=1 Tax=Pseudarthrobacter raffinosi TaxID=2953651 RepID=UPI00208E023B|nr:MULTISPECIES: sugar ABC transporter ATP-binding protein [unclassified Pseudarthrobacter]MCO4252011.1 sugar ABC transporter ATP-binding protein [Pseudarthrobacter sp. MDT3-9]MCO4262843.1 sugar ABC transporter ATP-binding protein [Pseudarthrobacter sp. MDT3-26]